MGEQKAASWDTHGVHVLATQERHTDELEGHRQQLGHLKEAIREHAIAVRTWTWIGTAVLSLVILGVGQWVRLSVTSVYEAQAARAGAAVVTLSREQQIEAIADAARSVPAGVGRVKSTGWPRVGTLAAMLPHQLVTGALRDAACTRYKDACVPP